jgi:hypothetical protein
MLCAIAIQFALFVVLNKEQVLYHLILTASTLACCSQDHAMNLTYIANTNNMQKCNFKQLFCHFIDQVKSQWSGFEKALEQTKEAHLQLEAILVKGTQSQRERVRVLVGNHVCNSLE